MPLVFYGVDEEFAAATGDNVNVSSGLSRFDNPPSGFKDLIITVNEGDPDPRHFEVGDTYDVSWAGHGGGTIEDAEVVRSDMAPGEGGIIVLEGIDENGELTQIIWTPDFDLEQWYSDNYNPAAEPQFYVEDTNASYSHEYICFAAETRIAAAVGAIQAGNLWEGDRITTLDAGPQPVRWIGRRNVRGQGANAPVLFESGTIGNHSPLRLSQQHRVMLRSPLAELMYGAPEVLVPAKALVNGVDIRYDPCPRITYVHFLLPAHQIVFAEGATCESLLPGEMAQRRANLPFNRAVTAQRAARPILTYVEAVALGQRCPPPQPERPSVQRPKLCGALI